MIDLLKRKDGKTLEFKENARSLDPIIKTVISFANTAGGTIVIGIEDGTKAVVGVERPLREEERIANVIAESVAPMFLPNISIRSFRGRELLVIEVPHVIGPHYLKAKGVEKGTYVRLGSTNRLADSETIHSLKLLTKNIYFDEQPCIEAKPSDLEISKKKRELIRLGLLVEHFGEYYPSNGSLILFAKDRSRWFPDAMIRAVCFAGNSRAAIIDHKDFSSPPLQALDEAIAFVERHTPTAAKIGRLKREDLFLYPPIAVREAIVNAVLHADYSVKGCAIQVAVFKDRLEITNPGSLPFGQTLEDAVLGISRLRNRLIGKIFRRMGVVEALGTGMQRIVESTLERGMEMPLFEERNGQFRVTLFGSRAKQRKLQEWEEELVVHLQIGKGITSKEASMLWGVTTRTARSRLKAMSERGLLFRLATAEKDPHAIYLLCA